MTLQRNGKNFIHAGKLGMGRWSRCSSLSKTLNAAFRSAADFGALWQDVVRDYTRRTLTVAGDKLNALEGIVQELRRQTGDEYLAGLWKRHLVSGLSWYQDATHNGSECLLWNTERNCPTWSWINTDGPVTFSQAENSSVVVEDAKISGNEMMGEYPNLRLEVDGAITLRAPMSTLPIEQILPNFIFPGPDSVVSAFTNVIFVDGALTNPEFAVENLDGEPRANPNSDIILKAPDDMRFLELSWGRTGGRQNIAKVSLGLLLVPANAAGRTDVFQRLGFFVVALEEEVVEWPGPIATLSFGPGNVKPTIFGEIWRKTLQEEVVTII